jgi:PAS domain S-box-containing protein
VLQSQLAAIVQCSDDAIVGKTAEGIITSWNPAAERLYGYSTEEIVGKPIGTLVPPERAGEDQDILDRVLSGEQIDHYETQRVRKDGTLVDISLTVSPIKDADDKIVGASAIARDIGESKRAQAALEEQRRASEQATRAQSEFLAGMSYELRTQLNTIIGFSQLMFDGKIGGSEGEQKEFLEEILTSSRHLRELIDEVLDFATSEPSGADAEDRSPSVPETGAPPRGRRILVIEDDLRDQGWVRRILSAAGHVVEVARTGAEAIARARESHFDLVTLDLVLPDMGGLEVLYAIRSEGRNPDVAFVALTRTPEQKLPKVLSVDEWLVKPEAEEGLIEALKRVGIEEGEGQTVLVIDDDRSSLELAETTIAQLGCKVFATSSSVEGLEMVANHSPAAIVLDLIMPETGSLEFFDRLRASEAGRRVPVIVWTYKDLGAADYLGLQGSAHSVIWKGSTIGEGTTLVTHELSRSLMEAVEAAFSRRPGESGGEEMAGEELSNGGNVDPRS